MIRVLTGVNKLDTGLKMIKRNICYRIISILQIILLMTGNHAMAANLNKVDTKSLPPDGGSKYNRLIFEKSPYLLQHAENPIDWYPWGEEAFTKAIKENKPVFLSIGYSTCHWCHVMARESFEDLEVANIINRHFVAIKVDREERPDIDTIYMKACQALTGGGGWPLTVIITPDKKPFYAGTYFPKDNKYGRPGLIEILNKIEELWRTEKTKVVNSADSLTGFIAEQVSDTQDESIVPGKNLTSKAYAQLAGSYDSKHGGFGKAPKFPTPHQMMFLLRYWKRTGDEKALKMVRHTLTSLRQGGIYDQLGFGFHRYSTDSKFLVPHFEKMLYDQALLVLVYLEAFQATKEQLFADTARETIEYVLRDMTSKTGGFYSAEDADSEGEEGLFYLWTGSELNSILGKDKSTLFNAKYQVTTEGNYLDEATREMTGKNILHMAKNDTDVRSFSNERDKLFTVREKRVHPFKDDKIITAWNGLMIAAMAQAGRILENPKYTTAAENAAGFILKEMVDKKGRLLRSHREGKGDLSAFQDDHAFMVYGLMELYESTFKVSYLNEAVSLNSKMIELFWDKKDGAFNFSGPGNEKLLVPVREFYDGALPAGNSVALLNLLKLSRLLDNKELGEMADKLSVSIGQEAAEYPAGFTMFLTALDFILGSSGEIVIAGRQEDDNTLRILQTINSHFSPNKIVLLHQPEEAGKELEKIAPYTEFQVMMDGKTTAYLCQNYTCEKPLTDPKEIEVKMATFPAD